MPAGAAHGRSPARVMAPPGDRRRTGDRGEAAAAAFLEAAGLVVRDRNWRCRYGELDLVCDDGDVLVFVEVRTRATPTHGSPEASIGPRKQRSVVRTARHWLARHGVRDRPVRFDVVAVDLVDLVDRDAGAPAVRHHRGAFDAGTGSPW